MRMALGQSPAVELLRRADDCQAADNRAIMSPWPGAAPADIIARCLRAHATAVMAPWCICKRLRLSEASSRNKRALPLDGEAQRCRSHSETFFTTLR